ncbi:outer membrane protein [Polynucleobacter sphagniphilus]|uniref:outer membrane protein n=2 Tax=Polynucleobacter sphagniphilus TaxID=1743169 RepID=UPI0024753FDA|nr:hypothetical protein [Polynucleobacter sphagniphilus]MDH6523600.1 outer membrane immunogenic protein [Polynucleobacter sphagniphilus]
MKKIKMSALVLAAASIASTGAMAQSSKTNAWEGAYGQWSVGFASFSPKIGSTTATPNPGSLLYPYPALLGQTISASGSANTLNTPTNAISAGYNFGVNQDYVLGIGASYYIGASGSGNGSFSLSAPGAPSNPPPYTVPALNTTTPVTYQLKNLWSVTLQPGYVIDKDRLVYAKVGYTGVTIGLNGPIASYQTSTLSGYSLGLGYKQMITDSIYLLGEANYGGFSNKSATLSTSIGTNVGTTLGGSGFDFLVGVGYRF